MVGLLDEPASRILKMVRDLRLLYWFSVVLTLKVLTGNTEGTQTPYTGTHPTLTTLSSGPVKEVSRRQNTPSVLNTGVLPIFWFRRWSDI